MNDNVIVVTGAAPLSPGVVARLADDAVVIAADGALDAAIAAGLAPAMLVGDLDSVSADGLAWAEAHATIHRHDPDKDHTDTELALELAVGLDPARLVMVSGGGDRLDHTLAAIGALARPALTSVPRLEAWWAGQSIVVVHGPGRAVIDIRPGATVSLIALRGPCTGIGIAGVRWPLDGADLEPLAGHGVSNIALDPVVDVRVSSGVLAVFVDPPVEARRDPAARPSLDGIAHPATAPTAPAPTPAPTKPAPTPAPTTPAPTTPAPTLTEAS